MSANIAGLRSQVAGVSLANNQKTSLLAIFNNDQTITDLVVNMIQTGNSSQNAMVGVNAGPAPSPNPVYVANHALYKHKWTEDKGNPKSNILMASSDVLSFFKNILILDNGRI